MLCDDLCVSQLLVGEGGHELEQLVVGELHCCVAVRYPSPLGVILSGRFDPPASRLVLRRDGSQLQAGAAPNPRRIGSIVLLLV